MTIAAFFLIFLSVFLHAFWHFLAKGGKPQMAFFIPVCLASFLMTGLHLPWCDVAWCNLPWQFWLIMAGTVASGLINLVGLCRAYRLTDVSLAYPLARALPVLFTAVLTMIFNLGNPPGRVALAGMLVVMAGTLIMPLRTFREFRWKNYWNPALSGIVLAALGTTGYTIFDSLNMSLLQQYGNTGRFDCAISYGWLREGILCSAILIFVLSRREERKQLQLKQLFRLRPCLTGVCSGIAYLLILIAMGCVTNICFVQAFRQMSLPIGVLLGIFLLKEPPFRPRITGMILVVIGLMLTAVR